MSRSGKNELGRKIRGTTKRERKRRGKLKKKQNMKNNTNGSY